LKKKLQREGLFRELKRRKAYEKPSERRAREKGEAIRRGRKAARKLAEREGLIAKPRVKRPVFLGGVNSCRVPTRWKNAQAKKLCYQSLRIKMEKVMAKTIARRKRVVRRDWTRAEVRELRQHSKDRTRVKAISRALKRTPGALRQKARALGIPLGHRRTKKKRAS
jgi:small subunit ribosomal protein S21